MTYSKQTVTDKEGHLYQLAAEQTEHHLEIGLFDDRTWIGKAECLLYPGVMELADIVIWEKPVFSRRGLWRLVPYNLYCRLKGKDYRRRGLGTELLKAVIAKACELGITHIRGFVTNGGIADNPKLLEWYQKHGFTVIPVPSPGSKTDKKARIEMDL